MCDEKSVDTIAEYDNYDFNQSNHMEQDNHPRNFYDFEIGIQNSDVLNASHKIYNPFDVKESEQDVRSDDMLEQKMLSEFELGDEDSIDLVLNNTFSENYTSYIDSVDDTNNTDSQFRLPGSNFTTLSAVENSSNSSGKTKMLATSLCRN